MQKFSEFICKHKKSVLVISAVLFVLSLIGMNLTKINYDILVYLPEDIETIKGQKILTDDFHMGAFSVATIENMPAKEIIELEENIKKIEGVNKVVSLYDIAGTTIPLEMLPNDLVKKVHEGKDDLLVVTFEDSTSADTTIKAVENIRKLTDEKVKFGGMSSMVLDTRDLSAKEIAIYIIIAVLLCLIVLELALDSYIVPVLLLANIGLAILFNLGSNIFLGEISYITKALVAVLQLGVTTDFSIFLYHSYDKHKNKTKNKETAMVNAIKETFTSVTGSSLTTIVGFLVLITMQLTLGKDLGIVMAKGVLLGVICVLTLFPSLLLVFDKQIEKTKHKVFVPNFKPLHEVIIKHHKMIFALFLILLIPAYLANSKVDVYYKIDRSLPETLESITANRVLKEKFNIVSPEMILIDKRLTPEELEDLSEEIKSIDGIDFVLNSANLKRLGLEENIIDKELMSLFETDNYHMLLLNSTYEIASPELGEQVKEIDKLVKKYDGGGMLVGEGPLMKDLIETSAEDFKNVNYSSIICIFIVLFFVLRSLSLPILLIITIEFAIFLNMSFSYFGGVTLPFVAPIVLGTIQLGATIDYAILITTTYLQNRKNGIPKTEAMERTLENSTHSIFVSGMCFFAATFGVGLYSDLEMVGSLCTLISRGALISMGVVITILPAVILIFDKMILNTTLKSRKDDKMKTRKRQLGAMALVTILTINILPLEALALTKNETVYEKIRYDGNIEEIIVNERLVNTERKEDIEDYSELENILNINDDSPFTQNKNNLTWASKGKDVFYRGSTKKELPIKLEIDYYLDGNPYKLEEILGKKGRVTIELKYKNLDSHKINGSTLYTPFTITVGTIFDNELNSNIKVTSGKIVSNGKKDIVTAIALPGLYESLKLDDLKGTDRVTISFETEEFSLPSIYSVVTPNLISEKDLKIFDKMETLYASSDKLKTNMDKIETGADTLKKGSASLKSALASNMPNRDNASKDVLDEKTLETIRDNTIQAVKSTFTDDYKKSLGETTWETVKSTMNSNDTNIANIVATSTNEAVAEYLKSKDLYEDYLLCNSKGESSDQAILKSCEKIANDNALPYIIKASRTASTLSASKSSLYTAEKVSKSVAPAVAMESSIKTASELSMKVASNVANQVKEASLDSIAASLNSIYGGVSSLDAGIEELEKGIKEFNKEGITKITDVVNREVKPTMSKVKSLIKLGENYQSFGGKLNSTEGESKFVMIIDSVSAPKDEKKIEEKIEKTSLWDRFKNLFK